MAYAKDRNITRETPHYRRMLIHLSPRRADGMVQFTQTIDVTDTMAWLEAYRERTGKKLSLLLLFMTAAGRVLNLRPKLNRYVAGWNLYQRDGVTISVSAKKKLKDGAKVVLLKVPIERDDTPETVLERFQEMLGEGRSKEIQQEKESKLFLHIPGFILQPLVRLFMWLHHRHWLPGFFVDPDPFFTSIVVANLGSVGLNAAYHHLYEWGNATYFAVIGRIHERPVVRDGEVQIRKVVEIKYSFDERVEDGLATAIGMARVQEWIENPDLLFENIDKIEEDFPERPVL